MTTTNTTETVTIIAARAAKLAKRVAKFERKAAKLGADAFRVEMSDPYVAKSGKRDAFGFDTYGEYVDVTISGNAPRVNGWTLIARIEHTAAGNIIACAPGVESGTVPAEMRDGRAFCDHCNTSRRRNDTFVVQSETGELKRVGRNCLADFVRSDDLGAALSVWSMRHEIERAAGDEDYFGCGGGDGECLHGTERYLAAAVRAVALHGWAPSRFEDASTRALASFALSRQPVDSELRKAWEALQPSTEDKDEAAKIRAWVASTTDAGDYMHNLRVACALEGVTRRNAGIVASAVVAYRRAMEQEVERRQAAKRAETSEHFGTVGRRYVRALTLLRTREIESDFGTSTLYTFADETGNVFKWFASSPLDIETGDSVSLAFTVKRHGSYRETEETTITRATVASPDAFKWIGVNGEIHKTRKAMRAADEAAAA